MTLDAEPVQPVYSAFLCYNRQDIAEARRVHDWLESYHLPRRLHPQNGAWNAATRRLKPIFRDLDEMTVAPDISTAVREAIATSAFLIVLCTPRSAQSDWVGQEIEMFRAVHGDATILAALIEGTPESAFHPALLHNRGGALLQPLAADFRAQGDGPRLAKLKLVAVMAGVGLGELVQRDTQRRIRQAVLAFVGVLIIGAIVAALSLTAIRSRRDAEQQGARAASMSGYMLDRMRTNLKRYGDVGMLEEVNRSVLESFRGRDLAGLSDAELQQLAKLRHALGEDAEQRGDLAEAQTQITESQRITAARLAAVPDDPQRVFDHAQSEYYVGLINWRSGNRAAAQSGFAAYRTLARQLVARDATNPDWWMELGYAEHNLGMYTLRTTLDTGVAEQHLRSALAAYQTVARQRPGNRETNAAITDLYAWLGDTLRLRGNFAGAAAFRTTQRNMLNALQAGDPRDRMLQADSVANMLAVARIAASQRQWRAALAELERGQTAAVALAREDPGNLRRASQVRIFDLFKLHIWLSMPAQQRPSAKSLADTNGDCKDDKKRLRSDELAEFCVILSARRLGTPVSEQSAQTINILSERWGLDFAQERALVGVRAK